MRSTMLVVGSDKGLIEMIMHGMSDIGRFNVALLDRLYAVTPEVARSFDFTIVTDFYHLNSAPGIDLAIELHKKGVSLVLVTVFASHEPALARAVLEGVPIVTMPFDFRTLHSKVTQLIEEETE